ncbi:hypothetical protein BCR34DRAFT_596372 [Clohesyomyces aquaticus]|uniref:Uncharacterized protein n=1 Tax=Clohesyomyces aquaticus TaxID=1231657 RepID=A0A1Y2A6L7_9PLEO|nr:hypothetical protein BCR34DRAFT_596372 [Clohesyomyces aquaticus]
MRSQPPTQTPSKLSYPSSNLSIKTSTTLSITINIESQSGRRTNYRAIQRPDGVIVERPQYRPSPSPTPPSSPAPSFKFQPTSVVLHLPKTTLVSGCNTKQRMINDLRGMQTFDEMLLRQRGRDGYNGPVDRAASLSSCSTLGAGVGATPMQRFMNEDGAWTPYSASSGYP